MKQINSDQIIDNGIPDNTVKPIPRDLADVKATSSGKSGLGFTNTSEPRIAEGGSRTAPTSPTTQKIIPDTPSFIGVVTQNVKIKDDGTYAVDIIIEVEDILNVSDYEVRISKSAGSV